jgi:hypothetical protein
MAAFGTFNMTNPSPNLMLVTNNTWQGDFYFSATSNRFSFMASNNVAYSFGETSQPPNFSPPITGTVEAVTNGDIVVTNTPPGLYRITLDDSTMNYGVELLYTNVALVNLVPNPSYENSGTPRSRDRSHSGTWAGTLVSGGYWASDQKDATNGLTYQGSAWFWADNPPWISPAIELKIEFVGATGTIQVSSTTFTDVGNQWVKKTIRAVAPDGTKRAKLVIATSHDISQGTLRFDDAELRAIATQNQNFDSPVTWIHFNSFTNDGIHCWDDWMINTGKVTRYTNYGYSASLPYSTGSTNYVRSALLTGGVGLISFVYTHASVAPTPPTSPVSFLVQKSYDNNTWLNLGMITNILTTTYLPYQLYQNDLTSCFVRIVHKGGSTNRLLIDNITIAQPTPVRRYQDFNDWPDSANSYGEWVINTGRVSTVNAKEGNSLLLPANASVFGNTLRTPFFSYGTISFWYARGTNGDGPANFSIQSSADETNWSTIASVTNIVNTGYSEYSQFFYETNAVYLRICNLTNAVAANQNDLLIDNVLIGEPVPPTLHLSQNFDEWPTTNSYGDYTFQDWQVHRALINDTKSYYEKVCRLENTVSNHACIQSPYCPDGLGAISFRYARWNDGTPAVSNIVQVSADGTNWNEFSYTLSTTTNYALFSQYLNDTNSHYLRIYHQSGAEGQLIDEISIDSPPKLPADVSLSGGYDPDAPFTNDSVKIWVTANSLSATNYAVYQATGLTLTAYYRIGTNGAFTASGMDLTDQGTYSMTTNSIPPQNSGTTVQYYVRCDFGGLGSQSNSPDYYPAGGSNNPAWYTIPRNKPGRAWINEINYLNELDWDDDINEFIEICGPAGMNISGWTIQLLIGTNCYASYQILDDTILANEASGHGFFVLGDLQITASDMYLTNIISEIDPFNQISDGTSPSGIRLLNEVGGREQSVSYCGPIDGCERLYVEDSYSTGDPYDLQLSGTGTNYSDFVWGTNSMTPGIVNAGQSFPDTNAAVEIWTISCAATQITISACFTNATGWVPDALYITNLLVNPQTWSLITNRTVDTTNFTDAGRWWIHFAYPADPLVMSSCYFRVKAKP